MAKIEDDYSTIKDLTKGKIFLDLDYENLINNNFSLEIRCIFDFLGVDPHVNVQSRLQRQNLAPLPELISNFDEVYKLLVNTKYAIFLKD